MFTRNLIQKLPNPTFIDGELMLDEKVLHAPAADFAYALSCPCGRTLKKATLRATVVCKCGFLWREKNYTRLVPLMELSDGRAT